MNRPANNVPSSHALVARWNDAWLLDGVRTPFVDFAQALALVSPIDLGIKVARAVFARSGVPAGDVGTVIAGSVCQACFDAYVLPPSR
jgi:acetyl-CoA C-acetyltransferase